MSNCRNSPRAVLYASMTKEIENTSIIEVRTASFQAINQAVALLQSINLQQETLHSTQASTLLNLCQTLALGEERLKCFEPFVRQKVWQLDSYQQTPDAPTFVLEIFILARILDLFTGNTGTNSYASTIRGVVNHDLYYLPLDSIGNQASTFVNSLLPAETTVLGPAVLGTK